MTLTEFLLYLANNPSEHQRYLDNAPAYIQAADLSQAHKDLLLTGTDQEVMAEVANEAGSTAVPPGEMIKVTTTTMGAGPNIKRNIELE